MDKIANKPSWFLPFESDLVLITGKVQGGVSSSVLSVFFTDKFALSQSDARISVAYKICQWKTLTKHLIKCPPGQFQVNLDEKSNKIQTVKIWWKSLKEFNLGSHKSLKFYKFSWNILRNINMNIQISALMS